MHLQAKIKRANPNGRMKQTRRRTNNRRKLRSPDKTTVLIRSTSESRTQASRAPHHENALQMEITLQYQKILTIYNYRLFYSYIFVFLARTRIMSCFAAASTALLPLRARARVYTTETRFILYLPINTNLSS